jgi:acyl carrier protein
LTKALRVYLESLLPVYMVPSLYISLERIPLTNNGKVDLKALPDPAVIDLEKPSESIVPRNALEKQLTAIWMEILRRDKRGKDEGIDAIDINQNFFEMGGDSLGVIRLSKAIRETLNCELEVVDLFQYTTIASQAVFIGEKNSILSQQLLEVDVKVKRQKEARAKRRSRRNQ